MNRRLNVGDTIYIIMTPNNAINNYRSIKCNVKRIFYLGSTPKEYVEYDDENVSRDYRLTVTNVENPKMFYTKKYLDKIYYEDELDKMEEDINNLNKILEFKQKQKQELGDYIKKEFPNWKYKGELSK